MATTTQRRKYLFASRQEAEDKVREMDYAKHQEMRLNRALYSGQVQWANVSQGGPYRVGVFDLHTPAGPRIVVVFAPAITRQEPNLTVYEADGKEWREWREWFYGHYYRCDDPESVQLDNAVRAAELLIKKAGC